MVRRVLTTLVGWRTGGRLPTGCGRLPGPHSLTWRSRALGTAPGSLTIAANGGSFGEELAGLDCGLVSPAPD